MNRCYKFLVITMGLVLINFVFYLEKTYSYYEYSHIDQTIQTQFIKNSSKRIVQITEEEYILLSKLVAGEARGESYEGQVAVAAVVINRLEDPRFPKSIKDVIYQKNAFSVVKNGHIDIEPTESSYKAVEEALYGKDPTGNAIYFWNPKIATCKWIKTLDPYMRIGNHVFAK